jgi:hypothetical protein
MPHTSCPIRPQPAPAACHRSVHPTYSSNMPRSQPWAGFSIHIPPHHFASLFPSTLNPSYQSYRAFFLIPLNTHLLNPSASTTMMSEQQNAQPREGSYRPKQVCDPNIVQPRDASSYRAKPNAFTDDQIPRGI